LAALLDIAYNRLMTPEWSAFLWTGFWNLIATSGVGFLLFKALGEKWLQKKFDAQLADLKHKQQQELDRNRDEVQRMFNRVIKIHEKEFEVYPQAWAMLQVLDGAAFEAVTRAGNPETQELFNTARQLAQTFQNFVFSNEVFMTNDVSELLSQALKTILEGLIECETGLKCESKMQMDGCKKVLGVRGSLPAIKQSIQLRLGFPATLPPIPA